jgi:hypothetical protein
MEEGVKKKRVGEGNVGLAMQSETFQSLCGPGQLH